MSYCPIIDKAIGVHGVWRQRLLDAVTKGYCDISSENASKFNVCQLGLWIYSDDMRPVFHLKEYQDVEQYHKKFHLCVCEILKLVEDSMHEDAAELLARDKPFYQVSQELVKALLQLDKTLKDNEIKFSKNYEFDPCILFGLKNQ